MNNFIFEYERLLYLVLFVIFIFSLLFTLASAGQKLLWFLMSSIVLSASLIGLIMVHSQINKHVDINHEYYISAGTKHKSMRIYKKDNPIEEQLLIDEGLNPNVKVKLLSEIDCNDYSYEECLGKVKTVVSKL